jgi:hypothetical protein
MIIQTLDTGLNDYWKVPVRLLCEFAIVDYISSFSYLGNGKDALNEKGYAYLEIDADVLVFAKALKYNDLNYSYDHDTLQKSFTLTNRNHSKWASLLSPFDVELLSDYTWGTISDSLLKAINYKEDDLEQFAVKDCES